MKKKYRVTIEKAYVSLCCEFDDMDDAGRFLELFFEHSVKIDDSDVNVSVSLVESVESEDK